jgi:DNA-binding NarL/FixJ family response regulator
MKKDIIRIVIADEQGLFIESFTTVIERVAFQLRIVGIAQNGIDTVRLVEEKRPDIVLVDINVPSMGGHETIKQIRNKTPDTKIVILTATVNSNTYKEILKYKISGYLLKVIPLAELITIISLVNDKTTILSNELIIDLVENCSPANQEKNENLHYPRVVFSKREKDILRLIVKGYSNREIAEKIFLSKQTIKNYVAIVYAKLGVHNRSKAMRLGKTIV